MAHHTENYTVYWHDTDRNGRMTFAAISRYLQETAWCNAQQLGFGFERAKQVNQFWVLLRQHIQMEKFPRWKTHLTIETWPRGIDGFWAYRDYLIRDEKEEIIGRVASSWMLIDKDTRRPQKPGLVKNSLINTDQTKALDHPAAKILYEQEGEHAETRLVNYTDIDLNGHVTNSKYAEWIYDALGFKLMDLYIGNYHVNFMAEAHERDEIQINYYEQQEKISIKAQRKSDGRIIFLAELS